MTPKVSVLLPVRDAEATIARAVTDLLNQTERALEVIAIDDGSTDGTGAVLDGLARGDARLKVLHLPPSGIVAALNRGLAEAQAPFIARMDGDDECDPRRIALSLEALAADPSLAGVGTQVEMFRDDQPVSPNLRAYVSWLNGLTTPEALFADRLVESPLCHPTLTLRRGALGEGWHDGDFAEDWDLILRILAGGGRLKCIAPVLFRWRDHARRLTRTDRRYAHDQHLGLKARFLKPLLVAPVTVWGAGEIGLALARRLGAVDRFVEVNPKKIGMRIDGVPVVGLDAVGPPAGHLVAAVGAKGARAEIRAFLAARGWREGRDFTCAA